MSSNLKESESHVSSELQISKHPKSQAGHDKLSHLKPLPTACADAKQLRITPRCKCSKMAAKCGHSHCHSCFQFDTWLFRIGAVECRGDLMQRATSGSRHLVIEWLTLQPTISGCIEMYRKTS